MKKILGLLLVSSSIFSMQLAYKLQTPHKRFSLVASAFIKTKKLQFPCTASKSEPMVPNQIDAKKVRIDPSSVHVPHFLGDVELYHNNKGFCVYQNDKKHKIGKYFTDPIVRNATKEQLHSFLEHGYLVVNRTNDGEFRLQANERLVGGGPILGTFMYWLTKSLCYGTAAAAVGTVAVTTGGAAVMVATGAVAGAGGAALAGAAVASGTAIGTTAGVVTAGAATGAAVATTAGVVGSATTAVVGTKAALVVGAAVTSTGGVAATVAAVEGFSAAVGTFFGMLPTP